MKHIKLFEQFLNESFDIIELIKHLESELGWNQGSASEITDFSKLEYVNFKKSPNKNNKFIVYSGMKGQSITSDIKTAIKKFGADVIQISKENGDNEHYYYIEIKK